ncbi:U-box domain-containing protein 6-like [Phragmites australis]|uniref:U-box domain-containing protein 6-like n=1 Tax=Phragmites australis TaxID=29695 RepID=UPI002D79AFA1|nr:U-box domain-containing protein 6-like [Phragmites australis]
MERVEVDGDFIVPGNWKLHGALCKQLYTLVHEVLDVIPALETTRPESSSGLLALSSLSIAVERAKNLLQYCSECSKLYLAVTAECVLTKFEKARQALLESLHQVEETIPEAIYSKIEEITQQLEKAVFALDQSEKRVGDEVNQLIQDEKKSNGFLDDNELEFFRQTAFRVGIASSTAALTERRALRRLLERAHAEEDLKKESIAAYLLHLMRKYLNIFKSETTDYTNSQCSSPSCSTSSVSSSIDLHGNCQALERQLPIVGSFSLRQIKGLSGSMPLPPEELRCPISLQLMYDPVVIASGQTYERACIEKWFNSGNTTCPKTRKELPQLSMTPNYCIKGLIASWCEQNGIPVPSGPPESPKLKYLRISSLKSSTCLVTNGVSTVLFEETGAKDDSKLDNEVALEKFSRQNSGESTSKTSVEKVSPEKCSRQGSKEAASEICEVEDSLEKCSHQDSREDVPERCEQWLHVLNKNDAESMDEQHKVVEQIRVLLKNDDELRNYAGTNGITEPLIYFLKMAICREDVHSQEVGTMALFNLAVSNDRNKRQLLSAGVIPLIEQMIQKHETCEAAIAMYLNLSCLPEAQAIIGSSDAIPFLIKGLREDGSRSNTCRLDALLTLYNLSLHAPNIPFLLSSGIMESLHTVLTPSSSWTDKALTVLLNLALTRGGKKEIAANAAMVGAIVLILDNGEPAEKEKAVSCLYVICSGDEGCSQTVLQEGVIPALVSLTANGTVRAKDKAQRLLRLFREQRQRELEELQPRVHLHEVANQASVQQEEMVVAATPPATKPSGSKRQRLCRSGSKRFTKAFTCLLKKWNLR